MKVRSAGQSGLFFALILIFSPLAALAALQSPPLSGPAAPDQIVHIRSSIQRNVLRVVVDLTAKSLYELHEEKGNRLFRVDFKNCGIGPDLNQRSFSLTRTGIRADLISDGPDASFSIVNVSYAGFKILELAKPDRWVVDFRLTGSINASLQDTKESDAAPPPKKTLAELHLKDSGVRTIIIDPGHGGKDPGAIGASGYTEKDAVLDIALRLKDLLVKQESLNVILTRSNDIFIPLGERTKIANDANADLFVSIHANSSPHRSIHGIEIYLLGKSSDKRALRTAARENNVSEEEASNMDKILISIKKDLQQEYKKEESLELAHSARSSFLKRLRASYPVVDLGVKTAPFYVLINTSMPSILAEVSFISNPVEEQRLKSKSYRQLMAESLLDGIRSFMSESAVRSRF